MYFQEERLTSDVTCWLKLFVFTTIFVSNDVYTIIQLGQWFLSLINRRRPEIQDFLFLWEITDRAVFWVKPILCTGAYQKGASNAVKQVLIHCKDIKRECPFCQRSTNFKKSTKYLYNFGLCDTGSIFVGAKLSSSIKTNGALCFDPNSALRNCMWTL